jgi:hypothetical protein
MKSTFQNEKKKRKATGGQANGHHHPPLPRRQSQPLENRKCLYTHDCRLRLRLVHRDKTKLPKKKKRHVVAVVWQTQKKTPNEHRPWVAYKVTGMKDQRRLMLRLHPNCNVGISKSHVIQPTRITEILASSPSQKLQQYCFVFMHQRAEAASGR